MQDLKILIVKFKIIKSFNFFYIDQKEWRNTAFCLSMLSYNEKGLRKLIDMFEFYREMLIDISVNEAFKTILNKVKYKFFGLINYYIFLAQEIH